MSENSFIKTKENSDYHAVTCINQKEQGKNIKGYLIPPSSFEVTKIFVFNNHHIIKSIQQNTVSAKKDFTLQLKKYGPSWQTSSSSLSFYKKVQVPGNSQSPCSFIFSPFTRLFLVLFIHHQRKQKTNPKNKQTNKNPRCFFFLKKKKKVGNA